MRRREESVTGGCAGLLLLEGGVEQRVTRGHHRDAAAREHASHRHARVHERDARAVQRRAEQPAVVVRDLHHDAHGGAWVERGDQARLQRRDEELL